MKYKEGFHMPKKVIECCSQHLFDYMRYKQKYRKQHARNNLYMEMRGYLSVWINSILKKWGHYESETDIVSLSWHAFMFCLDSYKSNYTIEGHFYTYTKYYLFNEYAKRDNLHIPIEELKSILTEFPTPENQHFERLLTLYQFRDIIPDNCKLIWDHAMLVTGGKTRKAGGYNTKWSWDTFKEFGFSEKAYYATRKSYVNIIKLILGIKDEKGK